MFEPATQLDLVWSGSLFQSHQHRQGRLAVGQVGSEGFADLGFRTEEIEAIVVNLIGSAEGDAVRPERVPLDGVRSGQGAAELAGESEKLGRFHFKNPEILASIDGKVSSLPILQDFSRANPARGRGHRSANVWSREACRQFDG